MDKLKEYARGINTSSAIWSLNLERGQRTWKEKGYRLTVLWLLIGIG